MCSASRRRRPSRKGSAGTSRGSGSTATAWRGRPRTSGTGERIPFDPPRWLRSAAGLRLAVVGADGFIGSHVVAAALAAGATVDAVCLSRPWRLAGTGGKQLLQRGLAEDWWSDAGARAAVQDCDAAIVLAYRPPPDGEEAAQHERAVNLTGSARLARAAADRGAAVVFSSSAAVYGPSHDDAVAETQKATPSTPYAAAKLEAEHALAEIVGADRLVLARISTVYGPGENGPRAIPSFVRALARGERPIVHGDGLDIHDFVHVADVAAALVNAAAGAAAGDGVGVVNVGSGRGRTTLEALEAVQAALETSCEPVHVPSPRPRARLVLDIARGRERLGLEPRRDFRAAVAAEARWLVSHAHAAERA